VQRSFGVLCQGRLVGQNHSGRGSRGPSDLWSRACGRLCQVSRGAGKARTAGVFVDVAGDGRERGA
jgi:hypothetical protein